MGDGGGEANLDQGLAMFAAAPKLRLRASADGSVWETKRGQVSESQRDAVSQIKGVTGQKSASKVCACVSSPSHSLSPNHGWLKGIAFPVTQPYLRALSLPLRLAVALGQTPFS